MGFGDRLSLSGYQRSLELFHGVFVPTEAVLADWGVAQSLSWSVAARARLAAADLRALSIYSGRAVSKLTATIEAPPNGAAGMPEALGYAYVLEGSALGAASFEQRVQRELPGAPLAFLARTDPARWLRFTTIFDAALVDSTDMARAARAASSIFDAFRLLADRASRA